MGIGLAVSKKIVESHRGSITVSSAEGRGTSFVIRLPSGNQTAV
ncbi:MAG: ATP-binding protein [bacterium]|nr:ATP-binding protein [bacterium]